MIYLVDTNIWLERLLDQARSAEVSRFLEQTDAIIVSLDKDFDGTKRRWKEPRDILEEINP